MIPDPDQKQYAFVANGTVAMVRAFGPNDPIPDGWVQYRDTPPPQADDDHDAVQTGYTTDADGFYTQVWTLTPKIDINAVAPVATVPNEIPLWAFRAVLTVQGIAAQVDGLIAALQEPQKTVAQVQWEFGNYIVRSHPLIEALGSQLGMNPSQIDDVFRQADALK